MYAPSPKPNFSAPLLGMMHPPSPNSKLIPRGPNGQIDVKALMQIMQNQPKPAFPWQPTGAAK